MRFLVIYLALISVAFGRELYSIQETSIDGGPYLMENLKGKVALIVNIASQCGYTPQLEKLEALYKKFQSKNVIVLGVPTNDFGSQTPQDDKAMLEFCQKNYSVTFPILTKRTIQGKDKRDLYKFLTEETSKRLQGEVGWNFEKFLVNKKGVVIDRFRSSLDPMDPQIINKIEAEL